jgi:hypothetical protein
MLKISATKDEEFGTVTRFPNAPPAIQALPLDRRGFPVPWFIKWFDGQPDFRVADREKMALAVRHGRCWICGKPMGRMKCFVIGPMCAVNRISSEPPSHPRPARSSRARWPSAHPWAT